MGMTARFPALVCLSLLAAASVCYGQPSKSDTLSPAATTTIRLDVVRMLRARDFDRLDRTITTLQAATERDMRSETTLSRAMSAFDTPDPTITPLVDAWVKERPGSYAALLARAEHYETLAWRARGDTWDDRTSTEQREAFTHHLGRTVLDAEAALRINARLTPAIAQLIGAAKATRGAKECVLTFERFHEQMGASLLARWSLALCLRPGWGGSYQALEAVAEEADAFKKEHPRLTLLGGVVAWDRAGVAADDDDSAKAIRLYTEAISHGEHAMYLIGRGRVQLDSRRYGDALADFERALVVYPEHSEALMLRAWTLAEMGRSADAAAGVRLMTELDPLNGILEEFREREVDRAVTTARRRNTEGNAEAAILRLNDGIALVGDHPEMLYWRGRAKLEFKDKAGALADLQRAVVLDPRHFDALLGVDFLLIERGQYLDAVRLWDGYLALEPSNGKALLARAKAHVGRGDVTPGKADAAAACAAGQQEGCQLVTVLP